MKVLGESTPRIDGSAKVTGEAIYTVDYSESKMLHGRLLRSPVPAGRIVRLDVSAALAMPGVRAVLTSSDVSGGRAGMMIRDRGLFADGQVRYAGEPVAAVAAGTCAQASAAVAAIKLEIDEVPPIKDVFAAMEADAPIIHPELESYEYGPLVPIEDMGGRGNIASEVVMDSDEVDAAFARADTVVESELTSGRQYQAYLEPKAAVAKYLDGRYELRTGSQWPFFVRDETAALLGVAPSAVRVINHTIGGGFGAKLEPALEPYAAALARAAEGYAVKMVNTRAEDMKTANARENAYIKIRSALDEEGNILAREFIVTHDCGAYAGETPMVPSLALHMAAGCYRVAAQRVIARSVYTNTPPTGAFRGVPGPYLNAAVEQHMDQIARTLDVDRRKYRLRHLLGSGETTLTGQTFPDADILERGFEEVDRVASWQDLTANKGAYRGVGISALIWVTNILPGTVTVKIDADGSIKLITAANDNGSGAVSMGLVQIAADVLNVGVEEIIVPNPDTDTCGYDYGSQGSRTTAITGGAVKNAALEVRSRLLNIASGMLEAEKDDLELVDGCVGVIGRPESRVTYAILAMVASLQGMELSAGGSFIGAPPELKNPMGCVPNLVVTGLWMPTYHVHQAEVEVDPVTGNVKVLRYVVAQEVGKAVNPTGILGQIQGGVAQGIGYVLYENMRVEDCQHVESSLESYRLPLAIDTPRVEAILMEHSDEDDPLGIKGAAEPPIVPVAAAIGNAIADAVGKTTPFDKIPITPEDVLAAISEREAHEEFAA